MVNSPLEILAHMKANLQEGVCRIFFDIPHDFKSRNARHKSRRNKNVVVASGFSQHRFTGGLKIGPPRGLLGMQNSIPKPNIALLLRKSSKT